MDSQGKQMVLGFCGDVCPPVLQGRKRCLYQDGTANFEVLQQISGMSNAVALCCCDTDLCNAASPSAFSCSFVVLPLLIACFSYMFN